MRIALTLIPVDWEYDKKTRPCFNDSIASLGAAFESLGHEWYVTRDTWAKDALPVILNYCTLISDRVQSRTPSLPEGCVIYNTEAFDASWSGVWLMIAYEVKRRNVKLWELRAENVQRWKDEYGIDAKHVPFGWTDRLGKVTHQADKPIDVLLYGSLTERRLTAIQKMQELGLKVEYHKHSDDNRREELMGQAKVSLCLRAGEGYQVEPIRLVHALGNECFVVCEDGPGIEPFEAGLVKCKYEDLAATCAKWCLKSQADRDAVTEMGKRLARGTEADVRFKVLDALLNVG